jgi:hypothetical protein
MVGLLFAVRRVDTASKAGPRRARLSRRQFRAWDVLRHGLRMNPNDRIVGDMGDLPPCDFPKCHKRAWDIVWVERRPVLVCKAHYWPKSVALAYRHRQPYEAHHARV